MKKLQVLAASLGLLAFAACSNNDDVFTGSEDLAAEALQDNAITFGTYTGQQAQTRTIAGATGPISSPQLLAQKGGFGVFAYYTVEKDYLGSVKTTTTDINTPLTASDLTSPQAAALSANFMYNQHIEGTDAVSPVWSYTPIKYWPNGNAKADDQDNNAGDNPATGTVGGKVSFFAYAPYVASVGDEGIVGMSANSYEGNPTITYVIPSTGEGVDLLWGTAGDNGVKAQYESVSQPGNFVAKTPATPAWSDNPYKVNTNLTKMKTNGKIEFNFKHALAKLGGSKVGDATAANGLMIIADIDNNGNETGGRFEKGTVNSVDDTKLTKVTVSNITISNDLNNDGSFTDADKTAGAVSSKGTLDLATGQWTVDATDAAKTEIKHVITSAGTGTDAKLATAIAETTAPASGTKDDFFTCSGTWAGQTGVPDDKPVNVYQTETNPFVLIPGTTPKLRFTITYKVRTYDANLQNGFSEVEQTISKVITFGAAVKLNKQYNILIHLGLTGVKFTATVSNWDINTTDSDSDGILDSFDQEVNLPINVQ